MSVLAFMNFGITEILVIGTVALLVFGGELPDVMRNVGRAYGKFRQGLHDMSKPVREEIRRVRDEVPNISDSMPDPLTLDTPDEDPSVPTPYDVGAPTPTEPIADDVWEDLDEPPPV